MSVSDEVMPERRRHSTHLIREMFVRSQDWSTVELCGVLDVVASCILKSDREHGEKLLRQQILNVLAKPGRPASGLENRCDRDDQPEGGGTSPACPPDWTAPRLEHSLAAKWAREDEEREAFERGSR